MRIITQKLFYVSPSNVFENGMIENTATSPEGQWVDVLVRIRQTSIIDT